MFLPELHSNIYISLSHVKKLCCAYILPSINLCTIHFHLRKHNRRHVGWGTAVTICVWFRRGRILWFLSRFWQWVGGSQFHGWLYLPGSFLLFHFPVWLTIHCSYQVLFYCFIFQFDLWFIVVTRRFLLTVSFSNLTSLFLPCSVSSLLFM